MKKLWIRYWQPSSIAWRKIGDCALALIPILEAASFSNPTWQDYRTIVYIGLVTFKFITNFSKTTSNEISK